MTNPCLNDSFYVQWHILDRCNLRCRHCYQSDFTDAAEPDWASLQLVADNLLQTMAAWGTTLDVAVTGGEPFLKSELFPLLTLLNASPQVGNLGIISNGTIWPDYAKELTTLAKMQEIRISLDGISAEINDATRGKGSLARTLENIKRWQELDIPVTIMFTVMKRNLQEIPSLLEFGKQMGLKSIIIERFFPLGQGEVLDGEILNGREFLGVWETILAQMDIVVDPQDLISYRAIRIAFDGTEMDVLGSGCVVARDGMALLPDGTVLPCRRFTLPIGNMTTHSLDEIWRQSPVLNALKDKSQLKGKCGTCGIDECMGCRAMCYCREKDFLAEDPHCWIAATDLPEAAGSFI